MTLRTHVARLKRHYGKPPKPRTTDPYHLALLEAVAYLVDDPRRYETFAALKREVGLDPMKIRETPIKRLAAVIARGGMLPPHRAQKLHDVADVVIEVGLPALRRMAKRDPVAARKVLKRFPGIGDPGADRMLLLARSLKTLAPDSNALRMLNRLGYGKDDKNYTKRYRLAAEALSAELPDDLDWLITAHLLLRRHAKETCRENPRCRECPLFDTCPGARV
ncbi:MAG TPA: hypothetical protein VGI83_09910 [Gemmatimonadales bacterium]